MSWSTFATRSILSIKSCRSVTTAPVRQMAIVRQLNTPLLHVNAQHVLTTSIRRNFSIRSGERTSYLRQPVKPPGRVVEFLGWLLGYYGEKSTRIRNSQAIFRSLEFQATRPLLYKGLGLEDSFQSTQQLVMLHMWMVHKRLLQLGEPGKLMQEELFNYLWENTTRRIRSTGVHEMTVNKHLRDVQKWSFGACVAYDHGFSVVDDDNLELGSALWRNLFGSKSSVEDDKVYEMAKYVRLQMDHLESIPESDFLVGNIPWRTPPSFGIPENKVKELLKDHQKKGMWRKSISVSGKTYWWHTVSRESQWEEPSDEEVEREMEEIRQIEQSRN